MRRALEAAGIELCEVPAGKYVVGVGKDVKLLAKEPQEAPGPQRAMAEEIVEIRRPFLISRGLVTVHQFKRFAKLKYEGEDMPIRTSAENAADDAAQLGGALPTWFEWEIAVRGPEPFAYPWGNEFDVSKVKLVTHDYSIDTESEMGHYAMSETVWAIEGWGEYAKAESPFGLRDFTEREWNRRPSGYLVRSFVDHGQMRHMVPGIRPGTWAGRAEYKTLVPFSGPVAACYGDDAPDGAGFRIVCAVD